MAESPLEKRVEQLEATVEYLLAKLDQIEAPRTGGELSPQPSIPPLQRAA